MSNQRVLDHIVKSLDKAHEKLNRLDEIQQEISANKITLLTHIGGESGIVGEQKLIRQTLDRNTASLEEHVRRTELLEKTVSNLDNRMVPIEREYLHKKAVEVFFSKMGKWIGAIFALVGAISAIVKMFG